MCWNDELLKNKDIIKIFLITEKESNNYDTDHLYLIVAKTIEEACKIGDIDIPNDYNFSIIGLWSSLKPQLLLECSRDICNHLDIELGKLLNKFI